MQVPAPAPAPAPVPKPPAKRRGRPKGSTNAARGRPRARAKSVPAEQVVPPLPSVLAKSGGLGKTFQLDKGRQLEFTRRECDDMYLEMCRDHSGSASADLLPRPSDLELLKRFLKTRHPRATDTGANLLSVVEITEFGTGLAQPVITRCHKAAVEFAELSFVHPDILFVMVRQSELPDLLHELDVSPDQLPWFACFGEAGSSVMAMANPNLSRRPDALRVLLERSLERTQRQSLFLNGVVSAAEASALRRQTALREDAGPISASILADLASFPFAGQRDPSNIPLVRSTRSQFGMAPPPSTAHLAEGDRAQYLARSRFQRGQVVDVVADSLNDQRISDRAAAVLAGVAKMFVVELTQEACAARDRWHGPESELGSEHIREAYRRLHENGKIPYLPAKRRRFR